MNRQVPRQIISRRSRPAKAPLSREVIVAAALDVLRREGVAGLSLRKVAKALDTGAASLYVYVGSLSELHELMLEDVLGKVKIPTEGGWRERLTALLTSYILTLYQHPGIAQLVQVIIPTGPNSLRITDTILSLQLAGGITPQAAAWGVDLLHLYVISQAAEQDVRRAGGDDFQRAVSAINSAPAAEYPHIHALRVELMWGEGIRFDWAVDVIINGLLQTPAAPPADEGRLQHYMLETKLRVTNLR